MVSVANDSAGDTLGKNFKNPNQKNTIPRDIRKVSNAYLLNNGIKYWSNLEGKEVSRILVNFCWDISPLKSSIKVIQLIPQFIFK